MCESIFQIIIRCENVEWNVVFWINNYYTFVFIFKSIEKILIKKMSVEAEETK